MKSTLAKPVPSPFSSLALAALATVALSACQMPEVRPVPKPPLAPPKPALVAPAPQREIAPAGPVGTETRIALLLPLHGTYASLAEMVRDGFMAALYAQPPPRPIVRVYDTGAGAQALRDAVRQATSEGARFVVGPLQKELVSVMATQVTPSVPALALNYLDGSQGAPSDFYQLGLAPEDEARAAAEQAIAAGLRRAASLTPQSDWGERIQAAFSKRLLELGGELVSSQRFSSNIAEVSTPIRGMMGLPESEERKNALAAVLAVKLEFDPRRRDDLDFVFLAARSDQGRLIVPQLKFNRLGSLPVFATAQAFDNGTGDSDLSGLRRCDMPLMLDPAGRYATVRAQMNDALPNRTREQQRLFALGYDAFQLIGFLRNGPLPSGGFPAATGDLVMGANGAINRSLSCAELTRAAKP